VFPDRAAATGNARSPRLDSLVAGTHRVDVEPDRRRRHASVSDVSHLFIHCCDFFLLISMHFIHLFSILLPVCFNKFSVQCS